MSIKKELPLFRDTDHMIGAMLDRIDMAPNDDPIPYIREYVDSLRGKHLLSTPKGSWHNRCTDLAIEARAELARERELIQGLRQVVKEYRRHLAANGDVSVCAKCSELQDQADALLADKSKPVVTAEEQNG